MHNSTAEQYPYWDLRPVGGSSFCEFDVNEGERANLAAAAPEMARMLLALHAEHGDRHTFDWAYWFSEIEAVLKKAGVLA